LFLVLLPRRQQELSNLITDKKYLEAIGLAITLEQPFRVMNIMKGIDSRLRSEALLDFEGYRRVDNHFIFTLVALGEHQRQQSN